MSRYLMAEKVQASPPFPNVHVQRWVRHVFADAPDILQHTVALVLSVFSIWCVHRVFALMLGPDAMFYDHIPIKWAFDTAHIAVLARFVWKLIRGIWK
jgi:hypothetical protein